MKASASIWNVMTAGMLGLTALSIFCTAAIFSNPQVFFNPFKPPFEASMGQPPAGANPPAATQPPVWPTFAATWTASPTALPSATATRVRTVTPTATRVQGLGDGTATVRPSPVGPTATRTETPLATRTPTGTPPPPSPTGMSGPYPGETPVPPPAPTGYP